MELPDRLSPLVQTVDPGMPLSRGLGAQGPEPQGSWGAWSGERCEKRATPPWSTQPSALVHLTWLVGDWGPHEKLQGAGGRPQHWDPHTEELRQKQLPGGLGPALDPSPECPHPGWSHRDPLVYLERQKTGWLGEAPGVKFGPMPPGQHSPPLPQASAATGSGPRSFLFTRASRSLGNDGDDDVMMMMIMMALTVLTRCQAFHPPRHPVGRCYIIPILQIRN